MAVSFEPVWFDSLGAKSSCTLVETPDVSVLIDPGIAAMQPSYPAPDADKIRWEAEGGKAIRKASGKADVIVVSHYHYDHYLPDEPDVYEGKLLLVKNPNEYINDSQRGRAEWFYSRLCETFGGVRLEDVLREREAREYDNPMDALPIASRKDFGDYNERRRQLLDKGMGWFKRRAEKWNGNPEIPELRFSGIEVKYPEGREFSFGGTKLRFTEALFHGIEYSRVGWIFASVVEHGGEKLIHSSDMDGPIIEDYAEWLLRENPDTLILDGPMTYMFGYMLNRINLNRAIDNAIRVVGESDTGLIIYDHHLTREPRFREHTRGVWELAGESGKKLLTAAEYLGKKTKVLECVDG